MSLKSWADAGWLKAQTPTKEQIAAIFSVVDRDLEDSKQNLSPDGRFNIAYNAALQLCAIVLLAEGWKPDKLNAHHRTIQSLPLILGTERQNDADFLDACRIKRNGLEYDAAGKVSASNAKELRDFSVELREIVISWLGKKHPKLSPWKKWHRHQRRRVASFPRSPLIPILEARAKRVRLPPPHPASVTRQPPVPCPSCLPTSFLRTMMSS